MVWIQLLNGEFIGVPGNAWQISKDVYDVLEAPNKSVATLARANVIGIFKRPPASLRREVAAEIVESLKQDVGRFVAETLAAAPDDEARKQALVEWLETMKADA